MTISVVERARGTQFPKQRSQSRTRSNSQHRYRSRPIDRSRITIIRNAKGVQSMSKARKITKMKLTDLHDNPMQAQIVRRSDRRPIGRIGRRYA